MYDYYKKKAQKITTLDQTISLLGHQVSSIMPLRFTPIEANSSTEEEVLITLTNCYWRMKIASSYKLTYENGKQVTFSIEK